MRRIEKFGIATIAKIAIDAHRMMSSMIVNALRVPELFLIGVYLLKEICRIHRPFCCHGRTIMNCRTDWLSRCDFTKHNGKSKKEDWLRGVWLSFGSNTNVALVLVLPNCWSQY